MILLKWSVSEGIVASFTLELSNSSIDSLLTMLKTSLVSQVSGLNFRIQRIPSCVTPIHSPMHIYLEPQGSTSIFEGRPPQNNEGRNSNPNKGHVGSILTHIFISRKLKLTNLKDCALETA